MSHRSRETPHRLQWPSWDAGGRPSAQAPSLEGQAVPLPDLPWPRRQGFSPWEGEEGNRSQGHGFFLCACYLGLWAFLKSYPLF